MNENITPLPDHLEALRSIRLGDYTLLDYREAAYEGYRLNDWWQDKPHTVLHAATEAAGREIAALTARVKELEEALERIRQIGEGSDYSHALNCGHIAATALNKEPTA